MKGAARWFVNGILVLICLGGVAMILQQLQQYRVAEETYDRAASIAFDGERAVSTVPSAVASGESKPVPEQTDEAPAEPLPEEALFLRNIDVTALQMVNPDVMGWICVPGTEISYPLIHARDRDTYLHTAWDGTANKSGSIFLEQNNRSDLTDFNTIIYGHLMSNSSMFGSLKEYRTQEYRDAHSRIYLVRGGMIYCYEVFSAYEAPTDSDAYRLTFKEDGKKQAALTYYLENAPWESGLTPGTEDRILTLSTCTGTGLYHSRWVVQAVLTGQWQK